MPALTVGPSMRAELERKFLKPGANILKFYCTSDTAKIDVFELRVEITDAVPGREAATPVASARPADATPPASADRAQPPERAAECPVTPRVDPQPPAAVSRIEKPKPDTATASASAPVTAKVEEPKQPIATAPTAAPHRAPLQPERDPGQRWAFVVGVSEYEDSRIPSLRYAARDAQVFHDGLVAPTGGRYASSKVKLLPNRSATNKKIKDALFNRLRQAIEEDGVFSYYLLEGIKGAAGFDRSGSVSVGVVTVYVSQPVRRATRNAQNPIVAGRFDPSLVIGK